MKVFDDKHIKNIVLVGGAKSGKTSLAETMLYEASLINRRGTVENKNTVSDFHEIEHERGISVYATPLHTEWRNYKINIIDTPGLDDFVGEIISSVRVADTCVMMVNAQNGVEVGTELVWNHVDKYRKPTIFAINQLDHPQADFEASLNSIREHFGNNATLMQYPYQTGEGFDSIIDLLKMVMYKFPKEGGKPEKLPIPEDQVDRANQLHNELVEKAAENDEQLMDLYFESGNLDEDHLREGIKIGMMNHELFPVFCLSATRNMGSGRLMGFIDNVAPSFSEMPAEQSEEGKDVNGKVDDPAVLFVFRTEYEPSVGKISFFKVLSGAVEKGMHLKNSTTHQVETINQLFVMDGRNRNPVDRLEAGDIGATLKLKNTDTNNTLHGLPDDIHIRPIKFPMSRFRTAISAKDPKDEERLAETLRKINEQDPTLKYHYSKELRQMIINCQGELHLATVKWNLEHVNKIEVEFHKPRIPYRETIQRSASTNYRHKKQSGGSGQFAEVHIKIEPYYEGSGDPQGFNIRGREVIDLEWGGKLEFFNCIVGGAIDARFIPSVLKGVMQRMEEGPLTGSYARDVRVILYDGKMHPVDSNDMAFQIAGATAFKNAFHEAQPRLLEPIYNVEVMVPEESAGDVMTDLQSRRAIIHGMDSKGRYSIIRAKVPLANLYKYSTSLRSLTHGMASHKSEFSEYASVPANIQEEIIAEASSEVTA
ncbi:MAG: elongation factor G [Flavobacteriales bacterium]|nr:elongation factor G [Flavobacteriales bacterium]